MGIKDYKELETNIRKRASKSHFAIVCAEEDHTLEAVCRTWNEGLIIPHFIGDSNSIKAGLKSKGLNPDNFEIINKIDKTEAAQAAVDMVHAGTVHGIMKGGLDTSQLMKVILKKENELKTSKVVCAMSLMEIPHYHKLIAASDPALCVCPSLEEKQAIIENCVNALRNIGIETPKVAVLAPSESVNPKIQESVDAAELKRRNAEGEINDCIIDGPLSYDLCFDPDASKIKGLESEVAGDPDLVIYPNLSTGNAVSKALVLTARAIGSSVILGTKVPVVLSSRSASIDEKKRNILLACGSVRME